jgi:hypothetical protein
MDKTITQTLLDAFGKGAPDAIKAMHLRIITDCDTNTQSEIVLPVNHNLMELLKVFVDLSIGIDPMFGWQRVDGVIWFHDGSFAVCDTTSSGRIEWKQYKVPVIPAICMKEVNS